MQKKLKLVVMACLVASAAVAQTPEKQGQETTVTDESAFTFTESQLSEDDNVAQEVAVVGSSTNVYAREAGFRFSPVRFRYRAYGSKYSDVYINGNPANDAERGEFRYSFVGGLNNYTRGVENSLPYEDNHFSMSAMGGSNNYNFRPSALSAGHRVTLTGANRNYTLRGMYSYNSGVNQNGWAFSAGITYRWASPSTAYVEGTFYNSLSYFLGVEKVMGNHSLSLVTWGNPTERGGQGASTDEMYWIANDRYYNPHWGYQNGKKRNSRIIKDFAPAAIMTWDWRINQTTKLTTSVLGKYAMYSSSRLNYDNSDNPQPDYYKKMPSYFYDVWEPYDEESRGATNWEKWQSTYNYLKAAKANRQINWDQLYYVNKQNSREDNTGAAMYYLQRYHDDQLSLSIASTLNKTFTNKATLNVGFNASTNKGMHYQTMDDLLGAARYYNVNSYLIGTYTPEASEVQYDLNDPYRVVKEGDRFGYDYNIRVNKGNLWATYAQDYANLHYFFSARLGGVTMRRDGKMRNGLAPENSYGKSRTAKFVEGGFKFGTNLDLGYGNVITFGIGYEQKAPNARVAFLAPQVNNDFSDNLKLERIFSVEAGYQLKTSWLQANLSGYLTRLQDVTEYSMYYYDTSHSFSYVSLTGINKVYYGLELGMNFKVTNDFNIKALGTVSDAKYLNNAKATYMLSDDGKYRKDIVATRGIREGNTPLTALSLDLNYHKKGWFADLIGNYYDRIYLYYSPVTRYVNDFPTYAGGEYGGQSVTTITGTDGKEHNIATLPDQTMGHGGFMFDAVIGKFFYLSKGRSLTIHLMLNNILNNRNICIGGMEQNRRDIDEQGEAIRTYSFANSPKRFYANGINGMLNITYRF